MAESLHLERWLCIIMLYHQFFNVHNAEARFTGSQTLPKNWCPICYFHSTGFNVDHVLIPLNQSGEYQPVLTIILLILFHRGSNLRQFLGLFPCKDRHHLGISWEVSEVSTNTDSLIRFSAMVVFSFTLGSPIRPTHSQRGFLILMGLEY